MKLSFSPEYEETVMSLFDCGLFENILTNIHSGTWKKSCQSSSSWCGFWHWRHSSEHFDKSTIYNENSKELFSQHYINNWIKANCTWIFRNRVCQIWLADLKREASDSTTALKDQKVSAPEEHPSPAGCTRVLFLRVISLPSPQPPFSSLPALQLCSVLMNAVQTGCCALAKSVKC